MITPNLQSICGDYGCVIPAAGLSSRMGDFKPLLTLEDGRTMIEHTVDSVFLSGVKKCMVVLGFKGNKIESCLKKSFPNENLSFVYNEVYDSSDMLYSIKLGIELLSKITDIDGAFILPGDMPRVHPLTFVKIAYHMQSSDASVVFPHYYGRSKHPPLISDSCFDSILSFEEEGGLRNALSIFSDKTDYVEVGDFGCCLDADTKKDFISINQFVPNKIV